MVPVTWAMLLAKVASRPISMLIAFVVWSRCCLARIVCCSKSEARSLFESCSVRSVRTPAALILLRTETSLLRLASPEKESCSRFPICVSMPSEVPRIAPMVAMALMFAPSVSSIDAYCDCTRPSSIGSIPESS